MAPRVANSIRDLVEDACRIGERGQAAHDAGLVLDVADARQLITDLMAIFRYVMSEAGHPEASIRALATKFRDAGRRSAPWRPTSSRVPGRPQDGADGNRIRRWDLPPDHKFYADEVTATLVEVKYYLQALSLEGAPTVPGECVQRAFGWLVPHAIAPGNYLDPIQRVPIRLADVVAEPRSIQSGHLVPLDRGGRHQPGNTYLMLKQSNDLQGNLTVEELLALMQQILARQGAR